MKLTDFPEIFYAVSKSFDGNMSLIKGDPKKGLENRIRWLKSLGLTTNQIVSMKLQHGTKIIKVDNKDLGKGGKNMDLAFLSDGLITNEANIYLFLLTADCLPISFYDPKNHAIGLVHVSRMNLEKGIIRKTVQAMNNNFKSDPENFIIKIGPSIGPCCYFQDLWTKAENILTELGILKENIENVKTCTYCCEEYFSYRKTRVEKIPDENRFATILGFKK
jgi:copper oxidase (laccase) domain-containing protein